MVNRYVYQHPRTARDKHVLVFREYEPRTFCFPPWQRRNSDAVVLSSVRNDGVRKGAKRARRLSYDGRGPKIFCELYNPRERFVGTKDVYI